MYCVACFSSYAILLLNTNYLFTAAPPTANTGRIAESAFLSAVITDRLFVCARAFRYGDCAITRPRIIARTIVRTRAPVANKQTCRNVSFQVDRKNRFWKIKAFVKHSFVQVIIFWVKKKQKYHSTKIIWKREIMFL